MTNIILVLAFLFIAAAGYFVISRLDRFINHNSKVVVPDHKDKDDTYSDVRIIYMEDNEDK